MPIVKCPNCGRERLVVEGKKKKCRKCGTPLSSLPAKPAEPVTVETIKEKYPSQVAEIIEETKREMGITEPDNMAKEEPEITELDTMTKRELIGFAAENGIEIDAKAKKKKILAAIKDKLSKPDQAAVSE